MFPNAEDLSSIIAFKVFWAYTLLLNLAVDAITLILLPGVVSPLFPTVSKSDYSLKAS